CRLRQYRQIRVQLRNAHDLRIDRAPDPLEPARPLRLLHRRIGLELRQRRERLELRHDVIGVLVAEDDLPDHEAAAASSRYRRAELLDERLEVADPIALDSNDPDLIPRHGLRCRRRTRRPRNARALLILLAE